MKLARWIVGELKQADRVRKSSGAIILRNTVYLEACKALRQREHPIGGVLKEAVCSLVCEDDPFGKTHEIVEASSRSAAIEAVKRQENW